MVVCVRYEWWRGRLGLVSPDFSGFLSPFGRVTEETQNASQDCRTVGVQEIDYLRNRMRRAPEEPPRVPGVCC